MSEKEIELKFDGLDLLLCGGDKSKKIATFTDDDAKAALMHYSLLFMVEKGEAK